MWKDGGGVYREILGIAKKKKDFVVASHCGASGTGKNRPYQSQLSVKLLCGLFTSVFT